jgi:hypothetical protein
VFVSKKDGDDDDNDDNDNGSYNGDTSPTVGAREESKCTASIHITNLIMLC